MQVEPTPVEKSQKAPIRESRWIDHTLITAMSGLALYTASRGINQPVAGYILLGILVFGSACSYLCSRFFKGSIFVVLDGWIYLTAAIAAFVFQPSLNLLLPEDSFPQEIWTCGFLCWMLALGSFGTWRDGPLLFQAVPGLAIFGLVGVYDTFPETPVFFFGFLLCLAILFYRAHARTMLVQAYQSGFSRIEEGVSLSEENSEQDAMLNAMRRGPWKSMAGPEWALASASAVILISLVGAPIIKNTVKDISGVVQVNLPAKMKAQTPSSRETASQSLLKVGSGPRTLSQAVVLLAQVGRPRYLRQTTYDTFAANQWQRSGGSQVASDATTARLAVINSIRRPQRFAFNLVPLQVISGEVPLPAETVSITGFDGTTLEDGTFRVRTAIPNGSEVPGEAIEPGIDPGDPAFPESANSLPDPNLEGITPRVQELVDKITDGMKTDAEKAEAIMEEIARRCNYNLRAKATPPDSNAVEYFLFDQHEGYCDLFASAMVIMARAAGLSARYATGFAPTDEVSPERPGFYEVRASDSHAWAEVYFKGVGWKVYDPTSLAKDVTPGGARRSGKIDWAAIGGVAGFGALGTGVVYLLWRFRYKPVRASAAAKAKRRLGRAYASFADNLGRRAKVRRLPNFTPDGWLAKTAPALGTLQGQAAKLNEKFVRALYAPTELSESELSGLEAEVRTFIKLKAATSP